LLIMLAAAAHVLVQRRRVGHVEEGGTVPDESRLGVVALQYGALLGANALIWFFTAPHTRFGQSTFWLAAGLAGSMRLSHVVDAGEERSTSARRGLVRGIVALTLLLWMGHAAGITLRQERFSGWSFVHEFVTIPAPGMWLQPMPRPQLRQFVTASGLTLNVPENDNSCWNGPLLCTPHPASNLALRREGDVASGFVTRGPWAATRFPNPWTTFLVLWRCQQEPSSVVKGDRERACLARARAAQPGNAPGS
jgi:hypothetical protein